MKLPVLRLILGGSEGNGLGPLGDGDEELWDAQVFTTLSVTLTPKGNGLPLYVTQSRWSAGYLASRRIQVNAREAKPQVLTLQLLYGGTPPVAFKVVRVRHSTVPPGKAAERDCGSHRRRKRHRRSARATKRPGKEELLPGKERPTVISG